MHDNFMHFRSLQFGVLTRSIGVVTLAFLLSLAPNSNVLAFDVVSWSSVRVALEKAGEVTESVLRPCAERIADTDRFSMRECVTESWSAGLGLVKDEIETEVGSPSARVKVDAEDMLELLSKAADKLGSKAVSDLASGALKGLRIARGINKGQIIGEAAGRIFEQALNWKLKAQELHVQGNLDEANVILETRSLKNNPEVAKNYLEILRSDGPRVADGVLRTLMEEDTMRDTSESRSADQEADRILARETEDNYVAEEESDSQSTLFADQDREGRYDLGADDRYVAVDGQGSDFRSAESELQEDAVASMRLGIEDTWNVTKEINVIQQRPKQLEREQLSSEHSARAQLLHERENNISLCLPSASECLSERRLVREQIAREREKMAREWEQLLAVQEARNKREHAWALEQWALYERDQAWARE